MITIEKRLRRYCKDPISKIENYEQAVNDPECIWHLHHRLELTLDGEYALSSKDLIRLGMYYHRPYFELIFLNPSDHEIMHSHAKPPMHRCSDECKRLRRDKIKENNPRFWKDKELSDEHKKKLSESHKGIKYVRDPDHPSRSTIRRRLGLAKTHAQYKAIPASRQD